jgi:translation initiation factor IF-2
MNNGKVRIYELSKELNLDNRDILAVCDQLKISVKSHSSTISDAEADRIRSAAEKYTSSHSSSAKSNVSTHSTNSQSRQPGPQAPVKKQQILEIRKHRPLAEPPKRPDVQQPLEAASTQSNAGQLPRPTVTRPTLPNRPSKAGAAVDNNSLESSVDDRDSVSLEDQGKSLSVEAALKPVLEQPAPPQSDEHYQDMPEEQILAQASFEPESQLVAEQFAEQSAQASSNQFNQSVVQQIEDQQIEDQQIEDQQIEDQQVEYENQQIEPSVAELVSPPTRPVAKVVEKPQSSMANRPILKRAKSGEGEQRSPETASPKPQPARPTVVDRSNDKSDKGDRGERSDRSDRGEKSEVSVSVGSGEPRRVTPKPVVAASGESTVSLKPKPVIELRRKPVRPGSATGEEAAVAEPAAAGRGPAILEPEQRELNRPTPPKTVKRGKGWEEEEEEQEQSQKLGKAGTKAKRRTTPVFDDEDELELELIDDLDDEDSESTPVQVTLSLVRPPKAKSKSTQTKPAAIAAPAKKKPGASDASKTMKRDRRETETKERPAQVILKGSLSVAELADELCVPETEIIKTLFFKGIAANINQILDIPTATMVAQEFEIEVETAQEEAEAKKVTEMLDANDLEHLQRRPPVVTIMGHVDHGKTTLLDYIRKAKVAQGEAGGITQHIGAYHVDVESNGTAQQVVFLDTPGHEAFTAMRARGARVTDIAVLVVAADDGVQPQTIEAVSHAKAAQVPIVVAINKIDKEEAQPDRVKQELTEYGLLAEEWGGDTIMVPVSAMTGSNVDTLLEMLLLVAEVEDLYANPDRPAKGTVIEAHLDKSRGPVATLIVQNGTLRVGDILVVGSAFGKVRAMIDDRGRRVEEASPSFAVEVLGLSDVPAAGDEFEVLADEREARTIASDRADQQRQTRLQQAMGSRRVSLNTISAQAQEGELKELNLILKADVQGSVEAILNALQQLPQKEVQLRVLLSAPGEITETDVDLAAASQAVILGFNTTFASGARQAADAAGVDVRDYNIIYKLLEDVQGAMEGLLDPELVEEPLGQVEVRAVFPVGKGSVAGCYIQSGKVIRNCKLRVLRAGSVVYEGSLDSLKRMRDDVKEVNAGYECGIGVDNFKDWAIGDIIETYRLVTKRRTLSA